jgi:hypothetical protein
VRRFHVVTVGLVATFALLASCGGDAPKLTLPTGQTAPDVTSPDATEPDATEPDVSLPDVSLPDISLPGASLPDITLPTDFTIPQETIDLMIKQFEDAGMNVDRACFSNLLSDASLRKLVSSSDTGTPSAELIQKFLACISP